MPERGHQKTRTLLKQRWKEPGRNEGLDNLAWGRLAQLDWGQEPVQMKICHNTGKMKEGGGHLVVCYYYTCT